MEKSVSPRCAPCDVSRTAIVTPIYKPEINPTECAALSHSYSLMAGRDIYFIAPVGMDISFYVKTFPSIKYCFFPEEYFKSPAHYNHLLMSKGFYVPFLSYTYMLIIQHDAIMLRDTLDEWTDKGYDYIGAPWPYGLVYTITGTGTAWDGQRIVIHIGNGGFSLRNIHSCIRALDELSWLVPTFGTNEDIFFGVAGQILPHFSVPGLYTAARFALERDSETLFRLTGEVPLGTHAWERFEPNFWLGQFKALGIPGFASPPNRLRTAPLHVETRPDQALGA